MTSKRRHLPSARNGQASARERPASRWRHRTRASPANSDKSLQATGGFASLGCTVESRKKCTFTRWIERSLCKPLWETRSGLWMKRP
jgi:hypothetical protein